MSNNASCPTYSPCYPYEEQGEWVWVPKTLFSLPAYPATPHQSPDVNHHMYHSFSEGTVECTAAMQWPPSPVSSAMSPAASLFPGSLTPSPVEPLLNEFDIDMALQLNACLESSQPWAAPTPDTAASVELFTNFQDADLLSGLDFGLASRPLTPPEAVSPASSVHDALRFNSPLLDTFTPASLLPSTTIPIANSPPTFTASPASPSTTTTQSHPSNQHSLLPCSHPSCTHLSPTRSDLRKHERKAHRQPFRCPLPGCGKGHLDQRALSRHLWAKHAEYAAQHDIKSERVRCSWPGCGYEGRGDNVARHARRHERGR